MTCRHGPDDIDCSLHPDNVRQREIEAANAKRLKNQRDALTPDANMFEILDIKRIKGWIILKVKYPNCKLCAHEGVKVMVLPNLSEMQLLKLKRIDPHFRPPDHEDGEAPSPIARFPGSKLGWDSAIKFVESL